MTGKPRGATRARAPRGRPPRVIPPPLAGISRVEPCEYLAADDLRQLASQAGLQTDLTDDELAGLARHLSYALSVVYVGLRKNDRATAATGEVLKWALGLRQVSSQQQVALGFGEVGGSDHRFSAGRYLAHGFGHESTPDATRADIRAAAGRLGVSADASPDELARVILELAANTARALELLTDRVAAIASVAPASKTAIDSATHELFDDLLMVFEEVHGTPFTGISRHRSASDGNDTRSFRPSGPAQTWVTDLLVLVAGRAVHAGVGAEELTELAEWSRGHPDGVWHAIHAAARRRKIHSEMH